MTDAELVVALEGLGGPTDQKTLAALRAYEGLLFDWSARVRLVSRRDRNQLIERHILDAIAGVRNLPKDIHTLIDIGTGAGLPGLPLKIVRPEIRLLLVESARMKILFLRHVVQVLGIDQTEVIHNRIEEIHIERPACADVVTARALAGFSRLWLLAEPLLKPGGYLLAWKGEGEVADSKIPPDVTVIENLRQVHPNRRPRALVQISRMNQS